MPSSMHGGEHEVQAQTTPDLLLQRGQSLCDKIRAEAHAGRPAWRIRSLYVPRVPYVAGSANGRIVPVPGVGIPVGVANIRNTVSATLAQQEPWPHEWTKHERAQLRRLYIAALCDIGGGTHDPRDTRVASTRDRDARIGRAAWASIGAWPWSMFGPDGALPRRWWEDDFAVMSWWHWAAVSG